MARIFTNRKSGFIQRGGRAVRQTLWLSFIRAQSSLAVSQAALLTSLNAAALALCPFTVVRSDQVAGSESFAVNYGQIVVTDQAVAIGVTAVPSPVSDPGSDWHVFESVSGRQQLADATGFQAVASIERVIDSKAMRKVDLGEDLVSAIEVNATGISEGVLFSHFARVLIKLH